MKKTVTQNLTVEKKREKFSCVKSLRAALNLISRPMFQHQMYQHYTTLETLLKKIKSGKWWLSCCTSDRLNDQKEFIKYGSPKEARKLYQTCFCHGAAESVAMWGLYQRSKPCAVRISLSKKSLQKWIKDLKDKKQFEQVLFRDLVYLAASDSDPREDKYEIARTNGLSWEGAVARKIEGLQEEMVEDWSTGLVKDYEWRHERESRLLVKMPKNRGQGIMIDIPDEVLEDMRFTFSPWIDSEHKLQAKKLITDALVKRLKKQPKYLRQRFRRSVLTGGLRLDELFTPCVHCDECKLIDMSVCRVRR